MKTCEPDSEEFNLFNSLRQTLEQHSEMTDEDFEIFEIRGYIRTEIAMGTVYEVNIKVENGIVNTLHAKILKPKSGEGPSVIAIKDD